MTNIKPVVKLMKMAKEQGKREALKSFAEKIKDKVIKWHGQDIQRLLKEIDKLLEEELKNGK